MAVLMTGAVQIVNVAEDIAHGKVYFGVPRAAT
jgi:hypothetical protein